MKSRMQRLLGAFVAVVTSAFTLLATTAAVALATVPGGLVDGQGQNIGRGGGFTVTTLSGWSALEILSGVAISLAAVALVAWVGIRSDNRARRQLALLQGEGVTGGATAREEKERKAA